MLRSSESTSPARRSYLRWSLTVDSVEPQKAAESSPLFSAPGEELNSSEMAPPDAAIRLIYQSIA